MLRNLPPETSKEKISKELTYKRNQSRRQRVQEAGLQKKNPGRSSNQSRPKSKRNDLQKKPKSKRPTKEKKASQNLKARQSTKEKLNVLD